MKFNRIPYVLRPGLIGLLTTLVAVAVVAAAHAANKPAPAGVAASPKVQQTLQRNASAGSTVVANPAMACPKCVEVSTTQVDREAKGAQRLAGTDTKVVTSHACGGCQTVLAVTGQGKARTTVAAHTCMMAVPNAAACCASN